MTYADIAGLETGSAKSGISGQLLNQLTQMDGFILVTRGFEDDSVLHPMGSIDPARDADIMLSELLLNDLITVERKLERLTDERKKGGTDKADNERQTRLFQRLNEVLSNNTPLRKVEVSAEESKILASFGLLTRKPVLIVFNMGEGQAAPSGSSKPRPWRCRASSRWRSPSSRRRMPRCSCRNTASRNSA